ncbi:respiratory nitrate reductase subunit gamma [Bacillus pseudomycoides]|uniref:respiratory nitrate reductase subunit gamma n=1 Tax=Bacillus TaxID=1386 RepID=UPI0011A8071B|nr:MULTISPECIES: respiratory nitrate reductase subunit gamma [Bacillus]MCX2827052.1 respiratory nitrate reductase subunit gamma [Bacillus sp. DHT2]MDR4917668.1 respiratory nitrate reductase subunit gamma [Bacillus pseudomycoides]
MMDQFLWVLFPYIIFAIFIGGHIFRYNYDQFGWTSKSSELLEKKMLRIGSLLFHFGIMFVIGGHIMGILIPEFVYTSFGISEHMYHIVAIGFGLPAGIASIVGLVILMYRRFTVKRIIATSTKGDYVALVLLFIVMLAGLSSTFFNIDAKGFDYRTTIGPWFRSLFVFQPKAEYMAEVPIWFKIHIIAAMGLFATWPFTRLVHVFSVPVKYLRRSYVIYRKRQPIESEKAKIQ